MGRHSANLTTHEVKYLNVWSWVSVCTYYLALLWAKTADCSCETFRKVNMAVMVAVVLCSCWTVSSAIFACQPI